jgi:hypothetical protein
MGPAGPGRLPQGPVHRGLRDVVEGVEEDGAVERGVGERQRLRAGRLEDSLRDRLAGGFQRLQVRVYPGDARSPLRR